MTRFGDRWTGRWDATRLVLALLVTCSLIGCGNRQNIRADSESTGVANVGVMKVIPKTLRRELTMSSELVPFQEIDVYAKEAGYVHDLRVDYGTRVKKGQLMAVLEI